MVEGTEKIRERHLSDYVIISCPRSVHTVEKELRVYDPKSCRKVRYFPAASNTLVSETALDPGKTLYCWLSLLYQVSGQILPSGSHSAELFIPHSLEALGCRGPR